MSRKKRMILTARELAAQRAAGPASSRGLLRSLVASVARPAQRSAADTLAALRAEVGSAGRQARLHGTTTSSADAPVPAGGLLPLQRQN